MKSRYLLFTIVLFLGMTPAFAGYIDFTAAPFDGSTIDYEPYFKISVDNVDLTFTPYPKNPLDPDDPDNALLYWDSTDGFGVRHGYEKDEIEGEEILTISFGGGVDLNQVMITDLFNEWGYLETGYYWLNGDTSTKKQFWADPNQTIGSIYNGELTLNIDAYDVDSISFAAPGKKIRDENHEFSVGGINISKVPEPSTLLLLSTGLLVGAAFRKRLH